MSLFNRRMRVARVWWILLVAWLSPVAFPVRPVQGSVAFINNYQAGGPTHLYLPFASNRYSSQSIVSSGRIVNIPLMSGDSPDDAQWTQAGVLWFGKNGQGSMSPNYADVRILYNQSGLHVRVTPVDYYLWYPEDPALDIDLTQWDSIAVQLDTTLGRSGQPQPTDYQFLLAATMWVNPGKPTQYHRELRGSGSGWNAGWVAPWTGSYGMVWSSDPGPNNNASGMDYGGDVLFHIPWSSLGVAGPPAAGTQWGLSVSMYDRDGSDVGAVLPAEHWPEVADPSAPSTWGRLRFGLPTWVEPQIAEAGRTVVRAKSASDPAVEDAWIGGGGTCGGGHEGGTETNHGSDTSLFVANQALSADFPCFSRSYLKFALNSVPAGKQIISAKLTVHHWGGADPANASPSYIQVFRVSEDWNEMTVHWNNAPMATENGLPGTWVSVRDGSSPGRTAPYVWDVSAFVEEAYTSGKPLNIALYSADTGFNSSKYLSSSDVLDIYASDRPSLEIVWGER